MRELMVKCDKCHEIFGEYSLVDDRNNGGDTGESLLRCPYCGCDSYQYVEECAICGEWIDEDHKIYGTDGSLMCEDCIKKESTEKNVIEYGDSTQTEVKVNGFLAYVFEGEIDEILKREFANMTASMRRRLMDGFVECDPDDFSDWYMGGKP